MGLFSGVYGYMTIPEKALFYREIPTFLYFRRSPCISAKIYLSAAKSAAKFRCQN